MTDMCVCVIIVVLSYFILFFCFICEKMGVVFYSTGTLTLNLILTQDIITGRRSNGLHPKKMLLLEKMCVDQSAVTGQEVRILRPTR